MQQTYEKGVRAKASKIGQRTNRQRGADAAAVRAVRTAFRQKAQSTFREAQS